MSKGIVSSLMNEMLIMTISATGKAFDVTLNFLVECHGKFSVDRDLESLDKNLPERIV